MTIPLSQAAQTWTIAQDQAAPKANTPFHVFHIHTNGFQVVDNPDWPVKPAVPIWMDSITLPAPDTTTSAVRPVTILQQFTDFTGAFVIHCHFLGHEDRGMMLTIQTVCPNAPKYFGVPDPKGGPDNCRAPTVAALKACVVK